MAQSTDFVVDDGSGVELLAQLNAMLPALASSNSGPSEPPSLVGWMPWGDSGVTPPVLRVRNNANTGWLELLPETIPARTLRGNSTGAAAAIGNVTMLQLLTMQGFGQSLGSSGYITIPSTAGGPGFVLNWLLVGPIASGANGTAPWLAAFPNACWQAQVSYVSTGGNAAVGSAFVGQVRDFAANGVTIHNTGPAAAQYFVWAVGN